MNFWDERYSVREYVYGKKPNDFFKQELLKLKPGKLLLPGEGEGRNAVFALQQGWEVIAYDSSAVGKKKAERLAKSAQLKLDYRLMTHEDCKFEPESFDSIALIYIHLPSETRKVIHRKILEFLVPGGVLMIEAFAKTQLRNSTGGPDNPDLLYTSEDLKVDFYKMKNLHVWEETIKLSEGKKHKGMSDVVRLLGIK